MLERSQILTSAGHCLPSYGHPTCEIPLVKCLKFVLDIGKCGELGVPRSRELFWELLLVCEARVSSSGNFDVPTSLSLSRDIPF